MTNANATYKYAHNFMANEAECTKCETVTMQLFSLLSTNKAFNNAKRVSTCDVCGTMHDRTVNNG